MGTKRLSNISIAQFEAFLELCHCNYIDTTGGHMKYSRRDLRRPIIFQTHVRPIPEFIIRNNLRILGISRSDFFDILEGEKCVCPESYVVIENNKQYIRLALNLSEIKTLVNDFLSSNRELINSVYFAKDNGNVLHYSLVLKEESLTNQAVFNNFVISYLSTHDADKFPVVMQFIPKSLLAEFEAELATGQFELVELN